MENDGGLFSYERYCANRKQLNLPQANSPLGKTAIHISLNILPLFIVNKFAQRLSVNYWVAALFVSSIPVVIVLIEYLVRAKGSYVTIGWAGYYAIINYLVLVFPYLAWAKLIKLSNDIEALLRPPTLRLILSKIQRDASLTTQIIVCVLGGLVSVLFLYYSSLTINRFVPFIKANYLHVFIVGGLTSTSIYWLYLVVMWHYYIYNGKRLIVNLIDPVETPGIKGLANLVSYVVLLASIAAIGIEFPILYYLFRVFSLTRFTSPQEYYVVVITLSFLAILLILLLGIIPHWFLTRIVKRKKQSILNELALKLNIKTSAMLNESTGTIETVYETTMLYDYILNTKSSTLTIRNMLKYLPTILAILVPLLKIIEIIYYVLLNFNKKYPYNYIFLS